MWNKLNKSWAVCLLAVALCGCKYSMSEVLKGQAFQDTFVAGGYQDAAPLRAPSSIVVCRSRQCAPAKLSMSREYIYNSLLQLFENNNHQTAQICQANAAARTCTENYITMPIKVGITPAYMYIDSVKITDVIVGKKNTQVNLVLNYNITYNGQTAECKPAKSVLFARNINHILLEDIGYDCKMTTIGQSTVKTVFSIDYIDLDFGFIGGYYSIGMSGPSYGGGSGYMMMRLPKDIKPLAPVLMNQSQNQTTPQRVAEMQGYTNMKSTSEQNFIRDGGVEIYPVSHKTNRAEAAPATQNNFGGSGVAAEPATSNTEGAGAEAKPRLSAVEELEPYFKDFGLEIEKH